MLGTQRDFALPVRWRKLQLIAFNELQRRLVLSLNLFRRRRAARWLVGCFCCRCVMVFVRAVWTGSGGLRLSFVTPIDGGGRRCGRRHGCLLGCLLVCVLRLLGPFYALIKSYGRWVLVPTYTACFSAGLNHRLPRFRDCGRKRSSPQKLSIASLPNGPTLCLTVGLVQSWSVGKCPMTSMVAYP